MGQRGLRLSLPAPRIDVEAFMKFTLASPPLARIPIVAGSPASRVRRIHATTFQPVDVIEHVARATPQGSSASSYLSLGLLSDLDVQRHPPQGVERKIQVRMTRRVARKQVRLHWAGSSARIGPGGLGS